MSPHYRPPCITPTIVIPGTMGDLANNSMGKGSRAENSSLAAVAIACMIVKYLRRTNEQSPPHHLHSAIVGVYLRETPLAVALRGLVLSFAWVQWPSSSTPSIPLRTVDIQSPYLPPRRHHLTPGKRAVIPLLAPFIASFRTRLS